jgi:anti-sigma regulatory factor (Ser/Thr protein kinase)
MQEPFSHTIKVIHSADISTAQRTVRSAAAAIGFDQKAGEELVLVVSELASNLIKYAKSGLINLTSLINNSHSGIQIESLDNGRE